MSEEFRLIRRDWIMKQWVTCCYIDNMDSSHILKYWVFC